VRSDPPLSLRFTRAPSRDSRERRLFCELDDDALFQAISEQWHFRKAPWIQLKGTATAVPSKTGVSSTRGEMPVIICGSNLSLACFPVRPGNVGNQLPSPHWALNPIAIGLLQSVTQATGHLNQVLRSACQCLKRPTIRLQTYIQAAQIHIHLQLLLFSICPKSLLPVYRPPMPHLGCRLNATSGGPGWSFGGVERCLEHAARLI